MAQKRYRWSRFKRQVKVRLHYLSKSQSLRKDLPVLLVCILFATLFWMLTALSEAFTTSLSIPIRYEQLPKDQLLVNEPPGYLVIQLRARGQDIIAQKLRSSFRTIPISVSNNIHYSTNFSHGYMLTQNLHHHLSRRLPDAVQIRHISPDTLHFHFATIAEKEVPVQLKAKLDFASQHGQAGPAQLTPDKVTVKGPATILDTLSAWATQQLTLHELRGTVERDLALKSPTHPHLKVAPSEVNVHIPVQPFTESTLELPIRSVNVPEGARVRLLPARVSVTFQVTLGQYKILTDEMFDAVADFEQINPHQDNTVPVQLQKKPKFVQKVRMRPERIEFIIQK